MSCIPHSVSNSSNLSCCQPPLITPLAEKSPSTWHRKVDIICAIAISVFAAMVDPALFAITFGVGFLAGACTSMVLHLKNKPMLPYGGGKPICATGYMDFAARVRFPATITTIGMTAFISRHIWHDPQFYVPFFGLFFGFGFGNDAANGAYDLGSRTFARVEQPVKSCCKAN